MRISKNLIVSIIKADSIDEYMDHTNEPQQFISPSLNQQDFPLIFKN